MPTSYSRLPFLSQCRVFFDFDNTIATIDVLDEVIEKFSVDCEWMKYERLWKSGKIGSRECLENQLTSVRVSEKKLGQYLEKIKLDPYFGPLLRMFRKIGIQPVIVSDSFSFFIESILKNHGLDGIKIYSNWLKFADNRLIPSFPYFNPQFCRRCAHCKRQHLLKNGMENKFIIYIGDGLSDICPAYASDLVFAKGNLLSFLKKNRKLCVAFKSLKDIYHYWED